MKVKFLLQAAEASKIALQEVLMADKLDTDDENHSCVDPTNEVMFKTLK